MDEPGEGCIWALAGDEYRCVVEIQGWWSRLSPDGRWLAYETQETGLTEVSVLSFPDGDVRYQISQRGGSTPAWGADGLEVYYRSGARLMAARVDTVGGMRVESRRVVVEPFRVQRPDDYDVHPDGTLALVRPLRGPEVGDVVAVFNWFGELRRRTAR
jgi:serine/threonine-protein kinase